MRLGILMAVTELNPGSGVPLYRQIMEILRAEITDGVAAPDEPMTEAKLIARFGVSLAPIRQALQELTREGLVTRKQGRGTFPVSPIRVDRPADLKTGDLYRYLADRGLHPTSRVSGIERVIPPHAVQQRLELPADEQLLHFTRLLTIDDEPFAVNDIYIRSPKSFLPTPAELDDGGSALALLEAQTGTSLRHVEHEAWASSASEAIAELLSVPVGSPVLVIDTVFTSASGGKLGWRSAVHRADEFKFHFVADR